MSKPTQIVYCALKIHKLFRCNNKLQELEVYSVSAWAFTNRRLSSHAELELHSIQLVGLEKHYEYQRDYDVKTNMAYLLQRKVGLFFLNKWSSLRQEQT